MSQTTIVRPTDRTLDGTGDPAFPIGLTFGSHLLPLPLSEVLLCLAYSVSGYNGHIHARCHTVGCVSRME